MFKLLRWLQDKVVRIFQQKADVYIGGEAEPYLKRWHLIPRNKFFNIYLHKICKNDYDRALHDHPWYNMSILLAGQYREILKHSRRHFASGCFAIRAADHAHRLELIDGEPCWTLFITGPKIRSWGFLCPRRWVHWKEFVGPGEDKYTGTPRGCGEND